MIEKEVQLTADLIFILAKERKAELEKKPTEFLNDLRHHCQSKLNHKDYTVRISSEINIAACDYILETRP